MKEVIQKHRLALIASLGKTTRPHAPAWECELNAPVLRTQRWSVVGCIPTETVGTRSFRFKLVAALIVSLSWFNAASAGAWSVIQETTVGTTEIEQTQSGTTSSGIQAINHINLSGGDTLTTTTSQTVDMNNKPVTFTQEGSSASSTQALNRIAADAITATTTQTVENVGSVSFSQPSSGSNNTQALNAIKASGNVTNVTQTVSGGSGTSSLSFDQSTGSGNLQAANLVEAGTVGSVSQTVTVDEITYIGSNPELQAANAVIATGDTTGVSQSVTAGTVNVPGGEVLEADHTAPRTLNYIGSRP